MQLFQPPANIVLTPQQQLAKQVQTRLSGMAALAGQVLEFLLDGVAETYQNQIPNGTPDETMGPSDYFAAVAASGLMTPVQLCQITSATLTWVESLVSLTTPAGQTPPPAPVVPPVGITITPAADGINVVVTGQTPLQIAQAAVIAARAVMIQATSAAQAALRSQNDAAKAAVAAATTGDTNFVALEEAHKQAQTEFQTARATAATATTNLQQAIQTLRPQG